MRIIAGIHRGRRIHGPKDASTTRPIIDRVKQSLFDRLWSMGLLPEDAFAVDDEPVEQRGLVLDIFSGTGSLGLEALSRGMGRCVFVEHDRDAVNRLERNIVELELSDRARVLRVNALSPTWLLHTVREPVSLSFLDPPYAMMLSAEGRRGLEPLMEKLADATAPGGAAMLRASKEAQVDPYPGWRGPASHRYGGMVLHFFDKQ
ncbi:MAG: RsmD family RNA methyltransferase [Phycisphaeraceae bacterium]